MELILVIKERDSGEEIDQYGKGSIDKYFILPREDEIIINDKYQVRVTKIIHNYDTNQIIIEAYSEIDKHEL